MAIKNMPPTYSGTEYMAHGQPTERCPDCGQTRNRLQVHALVGGGQVLRVLHPPRRAADGAIRRALGSCAGPGRRAVMSAD